MNTQANDEAHPQEPVQQVDTQQAAEAEYGTDTGDVAPVRVQRSCSVSVADVAARREEAFAVASDVSLFITNTLSSAGLDIQFKLNLEKKLASVEIPGIVTASFWLTNGDKPRLGTMIIKHFRHPDQLSGEPR